MISPQVAALCRSRGLTLRSTGVRNPPALQVARDLAQFFLERRRSAVFSVLSKEMLPHLDGERGFDEEYREPPAAVLFEESTFNQLPTNRPASDVQQ